jgi:phage terminase large subunit-like protein
MSTPEPMPLLAAMVLEDGSRWGERAEAFQRADAAAIINNEGGRRHNILRGGGMSKTTDVAAVSLALLLTEAPPRSRSHAYAADGDQAAILLDTIRSLAERTGLIGALDFTTRTVSVKRTGASLTVETADGASAFGLRPWLTIVDELGVWPSTANHRRLWSAIVSAVPKVPNSRLVVIGTAGSPSGLGAEAWASAVESSHWRTSKHPGPAPWWEVDDMIEVQDGLTAAEYRRLILCEWAEGDDALTNPDDVAACIRPDSLALPPRPGVEYVAALDVGTRADLTALAVGHAERREAGAHRRGGSGALLAEPVPRVPGHPPPVRPDAG